MKRWNLYVSLLLALMMCLGLAACGGDEEEEISAVVMPDTIEDLVLDDSVEYDYSDYMGTWVDEEGDVLTVEEYDDGRVYFQVSDADEYLIASGCLQYVEEYRTVYAHNDYDGISYRSGVYVGDELEIQTFGMFNKVSDVVEPVGEDPWAAFSVLAGTWYPDGDLDADKTINIEEDTWYISERGSDGEWCLGESGSLEALGDDEFEAVSEFYGTLHEIFLVDDETMFWDDDYYLKVE